MSENENFDAAQTPVRISDAASMLRVKIDPNERPYTQATMKFNNSLVDEWHEKVLRKICNKDAAIRSGQMWFEWQVFFTGKTITQFMKHLETGLVSRPSEKSVNFWIKTFSDSSIEELVQLGSPLIGHGWKLIIDESFIRSSAEKWEKIYRLSDDPLEWRIIANNHPKLWNMDHESPFWSQEQLENVTQKVHTILKTIISPN